MHTAHVIPDNYALVCMFTHCAAALSLHERTSLVKDSTQGAKNTAADQ